MARQMELPIPPTLTPDNFGTFWEPGFDNSGLGLPAEERLKLLGWLQACPQPQFYAQERGIEGINSRYYECSLVGAYINDRAREVKPTLGYNLTVSTPRFEDNPIGEFEPEAVPDSYDTTLNHGQRYWGYVASRVLIEQLGRDPQWQIGDVRVKRGQAILEQVLSETTERPYEFIARLAHSVTEADADPIAVLSHVFAVEFKVEGGLVEAQLAVPFIKQYAPNLWEKYQTLTTEECTQASILPQEMLLAR